MSSFELRQRAKTMCDGHFSGSSEMMTAKHQRIVKCLFEKWFPGRLQSVVERKRQESPTLSSHEQKTLPPDLDPPDKTILSSTPARKPET
mmetsp:Transcript_17281/g.32861  ORF Transcript_17281/g.32861 Transcript_17281/m.32861 type:complete len:90 (-) Transcript_17281:371-640(-)